MDRHVILIPLLAKLRQNRVSCSGNDDIRSKHGIIPHVDMRVVHTGEIEVCIDIVAKVNMRTSEIGMKRRFDVTALADFRKHFFQHGLALFPLCRTGHIELIETVKTFCLPFRNLPVKREIKFSCVHFFSHFTHHAISFKL